MNVYDTVNKLAQEIKESEEYNNFKKYKEIIKSDNETNEKIKTTIMIGTESGIATL